MGKRSYEEIKKIVEDLGYFLLKEYIEKEKRRVVIQSAEGYLWDGRIYNLAMNNVPFIHKKNIFALENIALWLNLNRPEFKLCDKNSYEGKDEKLKFFHNVPECQEEFFMRWNDILRRDGCPICRGMQVGKRNSIAYLMPKLNEEWHWKNAVSPDKITIYSGKRVFWICSICGFGENEDWCTTPNNRSRGSGCPRCADEQKESIMATELKKWCKETFGNNVDIEHKMFKNPETNYWLKCDIYIKKESCKNIYIEVHGQQHYKFNKYYHKTTKNFEDSKRRDRIKKNFAKKNGMYIEIDTRKIKTTEEAIMILQNHIGR